jgi:hypothetical protein
MAQRNAEVKMETTDYKRHHAEGRKMRGRRKLEKGERELEKVGCWTVHTMCKEGGRQKRRRRKGR